MNRLFSFKGLAIGLFVCALMLGTSTANANSVVHFDTSLGTFDVELYDTATPITVQNFLSYVIAGSYDSSFFHRLAYTPKPSNPTELEPFVLQGGGFSYFEGDGYYYVPTNDPIVDEVDPSRSNVRGTIAMAKSGPNTATSQFFFNLRDNTSLDNPANSGGFTVFGHVLGDGMDVVDLLAAQQYHDLKAEFNHSAFGELPLIDYPGTVPPNNYLEMINSITVVPHVPEPATLSLLCIGGLAALKRKRKK